MILLSNANNVILTLFLLELINKFLTISKTALFATQNVIFVSVFFSKKQRNILKSFILLRIHIINRNIQYFTIYIYITFYLYNTTL